MNTLDKGYLYNIGAIPIQLFKKSVHFLYLHFLKPKSENEDLKRREFILNVVLGASILLLVFMLLFSCYWSFVLGSSYQGVPLIPFMGVVLFFSALFLLSRFGYFVIASYVLLAIYFGCLSFGAYRWGIDLPTVLLGFAMLIVIASILISTRFGMVLTFLVSAFIIIMGMLQSQGYIKAHNRWKHEQLGYDDGFEYSIVLSVIMTVSWLSNREIERSLRRARISEMALKKERDMLEITVEDRTRELQRVQADKLSQLYRFAEFGRLSSGLFHDLMNPLTSISLYLDQLQKTNPEIFAQTQGYLHKAFAASKRMDQFTQVIRKQMQYGEALELFALNEVIQHSIDLLIHKAGQANVDIIFDPHGTVSITGNPLKSNQLMVNLISNAIDSYEGVGELAVSRVINIGLLERDDAIVITVHDNGSGIPDHIMGKIFDPFFTTKPSHKGTGIGLSTTKQIVEKDLGGTITVKSVPEEGTLFTIMIPRN